MKTAQAKKIAEQAGLECVWFAIGKFWRAYNRATGKYVVFDALWLRGIDADRFQASINRIV